MRMYNLHKILTKGALTTTLPSTYIGTIGELTLDSSTGVISFHDGTSPGGAPVSGGSSAFADSLSVSDSATAQLVDNATYFVDADALGLQVQGTSGGLVIIGPTSVGGSAITVENFGHSGGFASYTASGTRDTPLPVTSGTPLFGINVVGDAGSGNKDVAFNLSVTAQSDYGTDSPTSSIDLINASNLGWHLDQLGNLAVDTSVTVGSPTGTTDQGDVNITGVFKINGIPMSGVLTGTAVAGAITLNAPHCIVTTEALSLVASYTLTLTNSFIQVSSCIQVTLLPSTPSATTFCLSGVVCSSGSAAIHIACFGSGYTGTFQMNISVFG